MRLKPPVPFATLVAIGITIGIGLSVAVDCKAVTVGQLDDFQDGTEMNWLGASPTNEADAGPTGTGDSALSATAFGGSGPLSMLILRNTSQWIGNWTAAGVSQFEMDLRNPGNDDLTIRLAIAGPDSFGRGGVGDTYATAGIELPADDQWHHAVFDVLADDWEYVGGIDENDIPAALADVTEFRILHNLNRSFIGAPIAASFLVDNITAIALPVGVDGDYNGDGMVDAADYTLWRDSTGNSGGELPADGTGDMIVNVDDYNYWRSRFGNSSGGGSARAIPEPGGIVLGMTMLLIVGLWRWFDLRGKVRRG